MKNFAKAPLVTPVLRGKKRMFELGQKARQLEIKHGLSTKKKHLKVKF